MAEQVLFNENDHKYPDYNLSVFRINGHTGHLVVSFKGIPIHEQDVLLSYGALYGPDILDITEWANIATKVTDKHRGEFGHVA